MIYKKFITCLVSVVLCSTYTASGHLSEEKMFSKVGVGVEAQKICTGGGLSGLYGIVEYVNFNTGSSFDVFGSFVTAKKFSINNVVLATMSSRVSGLSPFVVGGLNKMSIGINVMRALLSKRIGNDLKYTNNEIEEPLIFLGPCVSIVYSIFKFSPINRVVDYTRVRDGNFKSLNNVRQTTQFVFSTAHDFSILMGLCCKVIKYKGSLIFSSSSGFWFDVFGMNKYLVAVSSNNVTEEPGIYSYSADRFVRFSIASSISAHMYFERALYGVECGLRWDNRAEKSSYQVRNTTLEMGIWCPVKLGGDSVLSNVAVHIGISLSYFNC
jgi:hypothetical protein